MPDDVGPRHHHVRDLLLGEVEDLVEHLALVLLDLAVLGRDLEQHLQLRLRVRLALGERRVDADRALRQLARALEHPDQRLEHEEEQAHGRGHGERDALGVAEREPLGDELADDDVEEGDDQEGEQHGEDRREPLRRTARRAPRSPSAPMAREVSVTPSCIAAMKCGGSLVILTTERAVRLPSSASSFIRVRRTVTSEYSAGDEEAVQEDQQADGDELRAGPSLPACSTGRGDRKRGRERYARPLRGAGTRRQLVVHYSVEV